MDPYLPATSDAILSTLSLTSANINKFEHDKNPHEYFKQVMTDPAKIVK